jgi:hypothetical protein
LAKVEPCPVDLLVIGAIEHALADRDADIKAAAAEVLVKIAPNGMGGNGVAGGNGK